MWLKCSSGVNEVLPRIIWGLRVSVIYLPPTHHSKCENMRLNNGCWIWLFSYFVNRIRGVPTDLSYYFSTVCAFYHDVVGNYEIAIFCHYNIFWYTWVFISTSTSTATNWALSVHHFLFSSYVFYKIEVFHMPA